MDENQSQAGTPAENLTPMQPPEASPKPGGRRKLPWLIAGAAVLLLLAAGAVYWFLLRDTTQQPTPNTADEQQAEQTPPPVADATPVQYKSAKLNIEFTHRKDWTVKEAADGEVTVTSPQISYAGAEGQSKAGVFTVKIRQGVPAAMKTKIEKAVAPRDSVVIAYAEPTEQQRQYTNLSYAGTKDAFNFFIVTGNAELKAGNNFEYALPLDGQFYLIAGGYGSGNNLSFDSVPKDLMDSAALEQAIDLVESLKIY